MNANLVEHRPLAHVSLRPAMLLHVASETSTKGDRPVARSGSALAFCSVRLIAVAALTACGRKEPPPYPGFVNAPISAVASPVAGKVAEVAVEEGTRIHEGQVLARLDSREAEAAVKEAQANVERARQALREAEANVRASIPTVRGAGAEIERAEAVLREAELTYQRTDRLARENTVSPAELDAARSRLDQAQAARDAALAVRSENRGRVGAALAAAADARASVVASEAAHQLAQVRLSQTRIVSPYDGVVVEIDLREGEWAAPGVPVVTVADLTRPWVRLDVPETKFGVIALGQSASIRVIALPNRLFRGHVSQIGAEGDFALNRDVKRGRPDVRTFLVRVHVDERQDELRPGMTAEVTLPGLLSDRGPPPVGSSPRGALP
jgi:HlyD family secretion protein